MCQWLSLAVIPSAGHIIITFLLLDDELTKGAKGAAQSVYSLDSGLRSLDSGYPSSRGSAYTSTSGDSGYPSHVSAYPSQTKGELGLYCWCCWGPHHNFRIVQSPFSLWSLQWCWCSRINILKMKIFTKFWCSVGMGTKVEGNFWLFFHSNWEYAYHYVSNACKSGRDVDCKSYLIWSFYLIYT